MTPGQSAHLSEEAINDVLIGLGTPESDAHLAHCSICSSKLTEFHSEMEAFNRSTLAWSEARPMGRLAEAPMSKVREAMFSPLVWALAATILVAIGVPLWNHGGHHPPLNNASVPVSVSQDSEAQIAQDNDLLRSVNVALNENEESPISEYHLLGASHPHARTRPELRKP
jgi:hypothetical protein